MSVENYYNPPPRMKREEPDEIYIGRLCDWIANTEIHGDPNWRNVPRTSRADIPRLLETARKNGLGVEDVADAIKICDGVKGREAVELGYTVEARERQRRIEEYKKLPKLR
jgi:hypothetical protein